MCSTSSSFLNVKWCILISFQVLHKQYRRKHIFQFLICQPICHFPYFLVSEMNGIAKTTQAQTLFIFCTSIPFLKPDYFLLLKLKVQWRNEKKREKGEYRRWTRKRHLGLETAFISLNASHWDELSTQSHSDPCVGKLSRPPQYCDHNLHVNDLKFPVWPFFTSSGTTIINL